MSVKSPIAIGTKVQFKPNTHTAISNFEIDISNLTGIVTESSPDFLAIQLDSDRYKEELFEWQNSVEFYGEFADNSTVDASNLYNVVKG